jgi:hypothetical protein
MMMKPRALKEYFMFSSQFKAKNIDELEIKTDIT